MQRRSRCYARISSKKKYLAEQQLKLRTWRGNNEGNASLEHLKSKKRHWPMLRNLAWQYSSRPWRTNWGDAPLMQRPTCCTHVCYCLLLSVVAPVHPLRLYISHGKTMIFWNHLTTAILPSRFLLDVCCVHQDVLFEDSTPFRNDRPSYDVWRGMTIVVFTFTRPPTRDCSRRCTSFQKNNRSRYRAESHAVSFHLVPFCSCSAVFEFCLPNVAQNYPSWTPFR